MERALILCAVYYFGFNISRPAQSAADRASGAASCWINALEYEKAFAAATALVTAQGWEVENVLTERTVMESEYAAGDDMVRYYRQALIDGEVLVLFLVSSSDDGCAGQIVASVE